jgi:DNA transposition AAA+ family ATPase
MPTLIAPEKPATSNGTGGGEISRSLSAEASSAHSRINIPLNLDNWKHLPEDVVSDLLWFHQWILNHNIGWKEAEQAIAYDKSTIFRVLKGTYEGNWSKVVVAIQKYRWQQRRSEQHNEFARNSISDMIFAALDYAIANKSMTIIIGESRTGKTISAQEWAHRNNHGRSVFVTAPVMGGAKATARRIAGAVGVNKTQSMGPLVEGIYRAFNGNRILIMDEAHRLLPNDTRSVNPACIELLRDLHDMTGCAVALISTRRLPSGLKKGAYQYEQLEGRCGQPVLVPRRIKRADLLPIVKQFLKAPGADILDELEEIANRPGRLGIMVQLLKVAQRFAKKDDKPLAEIHVRKAIILRAQMSQESQ